MKSICQSIVFQMNTIIYLCDRISFLLSLFLAHVCIIFMDTFADSQDTVEYRYRYRWLYIRTMDGTRKKLCVDDSKSVAELMLMICTKMGMSREIEYCLSSRFSASDLVSCFPCPSCTSLTKYGKTRIFLIQESNITC